MTTNHTDGLDAAGVAELLPCPHCGCTDVSNNDNGHEEWFECDWCHATSGFDPAPEFEGQPPSFHWNRRSALVDAPAGESLDERMIAAGMIPMSKLLSGDTPLAQWEAHTGVHTMAHFEEWLLRRHRGLLTMRAAYALGDKDETDDMFEWVLGNAGAFSEVVANYRQASASPTPSVAALQAEIERLKRRIAEVDGAPSPREEQAILAEAAAIERAEKAEAALPPPDTEGEAQPETDFKPCITVNEDAGVTEAVFEDVPYIADPVFPGAFHYIDRHVAMDDGRLVGMAVWKASTPPAVNAAMVRPSYDAVKALVNDCVERMKRTGESHPMLARWISEGLIAALASVPGKGGYTDALQWCVAVCDHALEHYKGPVAMKIRREIAVELSRRAASPSDPSSTEEGR